MPHSEWTEENTSYAMCFFPWIGGIIGIVTWGIYHLEEWLASYGIDYGSLFFTILMVVAYLFRLILVFAKQPEEGGEQA